MAPILRSICTALLRFPVVSCLLQVSSEAAATNSVWGLGQRACSEYQQPRSDPGKPLLGDQTLVVLVR